MIHTVLFYTTSFIFLFDAIILANLLQLFQISAQINY